MPVHSDELSVSADRAWMNKALHDLCQPLTALECRLVLGTMEAERCTGEEQVAAALRIAIEEALTQCARTIAQVRMMQHRLEP